MSCYPPSPENDPHPPRKGIILRRMILCASILLVVYGVVRLAGYGADMLSSRQTARELREAAATEAVTAAPTGTDVPAGTPEFLPETTVVAPVETVAPEKAPTVSAVLPEVAYPNGYNLVPRIQELRKKSEYIIGWITMDDLDEPVVLKDNRFFLNHDATGKKNSNGAIFMEEGTRLLTRPYTITLYGHNMKSGMMFGNLRKYEDPVYCRKHRTFRFDTLYEEGQYEIFAVVCIMCKLFNIPHPLPRTAPERHRLFAQIKPIFLLAKPLTHNYFIIII